MGNLKRGSGCRCVWGLAVRSTCISHGETTPLSAMGIISHPHRKQHALGHSRRCCWMHPHVLQWRAHSNTHTHTHTCRTDVYSTHVLPHSAAGVESWGGGYCTAQQVGDAGDRKRLGEKTEREILAFLCPLFRPGMLLTFANANGSER